MKFKIREAGQDIELCKRCMWDLPFPTLEALKKKKRHRAGIQFYHEIREFLGRYEQSPKKVVIEYASHSKLTQPLCLVRKRIYRRAKLSSH